MDRPVVTVSPDGHVTLPESIRDALQWPAGTRLVVESTPGGVHLRAEEANLFPPTKPENVFGSLRNGGPPVSVEDMSAATGPGPHDLLPPMKPGDATGSLDLEPTHLEVPRRTASEVAGVLGRPRLRKAEPAFPPTRPEDVFASLPYDGPPVSVEQMHEAIATEVKRRHARGRY